MPDICHRIPDNKKESFLIHLASQPASACPSRVSKGRGSAANGGQAAYGIWYLFASSSVTFITPTGRFETDLG
jgi:hypothetical protein